MVTTAATRKLLRQRSIRKKAKLLEDAREGHRGRVCPAKKQVQGPGSGTWFRDKLEENAHRFVAVLTGYVESRLSHGVLHVHVGHVLDQVVEQLRAPVHSQPVDLQQRVRRSSQTARTDWEPG